MTLYTTHALAAEVGATYRQIHYWTHKGLLKPVAIQGQRPEGTGNRNLYDATECVVARGLVLLTKPITELGPDIRRAVITGSAPLAYGFRLTKEQR